MGNLCFSINVSKKHLESDEEGTCELHHMSALAKLRAVAAHLEISVDFGKVFFVLNTVTCQMRIFITLDTLQAQSSW